MMTGSMYRADDGMKMVSDVRRAATALQRLRGLLFRPPLQTGEGLLLDRCGAIHTFGMKYPLDVVFMDRQGVVIKVSDNIHPRRFAAARGAFMALELPAGAAKAQGISKADKLEWRECVTP